MNLIRLMIRYNLCLVVFVYVLCQSLHGQDASGAGHLSARENKPAWEIKPGMEWKEHRLMYPDDYRKGWLENLYEDIDWSKKESDQQAPRIGTLRGLRMLDYYIIGSKGEPLWKVVDVFGEELMRFALFYSPDRAYSRQAALEHFIRDLQCIASLNSGDFLYQTNKNGTKILGRQDVMSYRLLFMERGGYSLWPDGYLAMKFPHEDIVRVGDAIFDALTGAGKNGYFPRRIRMIEERNKRPGEREKLIRELEDWENSMSPSVYYHLYDNSENVANALNVILSRAKPGKPDPLDQETIPNVSRGTGTLTWIRKHLDMPFKPEEGTMEKHVDGITGTFLVKKGTREYPVEYMIAHLHSRNQAMKSLFAMRAWNEVNVRRKEEDIKRVAANTQLHPGLVGDYDLCLKPVLNGLGVPIPEAEHSTICFVRGNTAVMLKNADMKVSVLPLARKIDEALKKSIKDYETPEEVR